MNGGELRERDALTERDAPHPPGVKALVREAKLIANQFRADLVDDDAVGVPFVAHSGTLYAPYSLVNTRSLLAARLPYRHISQMLEQLARRIQKRIADLGTNQTDVAKALGWTQQRFGNYYHGRRMPDVPTVIRLADQLSMSVDALLGVSDQSSALTDAVLKELLIASGMPDQRAVVIVDALQEAKRLLAVVPGDAPDETRSRMAAHTAWHSKGASKPN